jgi:predicted glycogen debranching enzyme
VAQPAIGRSFVTEPPIAQRREWLVTNGVGGFACGTLAGMLSRRYHGMLVAASEPPLGRRLRVAKYDETLTYDGVAVALGTDRWFDGTVAPAGYPNISSFSRDGSSCVWRFAYADATIEKRVWMEYGANTTYARYTHLSGRDPVAIDVRAFVNDRDFHTTTRNSPIVPAIARIADGVRCDFFGDASPVFLTASAAACTPDGIWYRNFSLTRETERGLDDRDDHVSACVFTCTLAVGESMTVVASDRPDAGADGALERARDRDGMLRAAYASAHGMAPKPPAWIETLTFAADQFIVARPASGEHGMTIVAGYPWFGDWGRDTMIALPGLLLATGRADVARKILATFGGLVDRGMLPNALPERGAPLMYNTVDAALWFVEAVAAYRDATGDVHFVASIFATLEAIVNGYLAGTRYGIGVDADGLVKAGETGSQVTWMDARVDGVAITPRVGKPVEISALWYNALMRLASLARDVGGAPGRFEQLASVTRAGFDRFWNASGEYLYDVIDGPAGDDATLRPNQLFAVSLPNSALDPDRRRAVVRACGRALYLPFGLRSLDPHDPHYAGSYGGSPEHRDGAYHQGTGWTWLLGPFATAHLRAFGDPAAARAYLEPIADALEAGAIGTLAELCQPEAPYTADGAFAQAWSVGEIMRAWHALR